VNCRTGSKAKNIGLRVYQRAYEHLAREGYSAEYGARELRRAVNRLIIAPVSDMMIEREIPIRRYDPRDDGRRQIGVPEGRAGWERGSLSRMRNL